MSRTPRAGRAVPLPEPAVVAAAAAAADWDALASSARTCTACPELVAARSSVVVGDPGAAALPGRAEAGSPRRPDPGVPAGPGRVVLGRVVLGRVVLVGEAPGAQEDAAGRPFVGRAGQLLDGVLAEAGLDRGAVAVLNVLKCRPPGNRAPRPEEVAHCRPWLQRQLALLAPRVVVPLGLTATVWFLGRGVTLGAVRGRVHEVGGLRVLPTYHPSAALRFGPRGAPLAALRDDLARVAALAGAAG